MFSLAAECMNEQPLLSFHFLSFVVMPFSTFVFALFFLLLCNMVEVIIFYHPPILVEVLTSTTVQRRETKRIQST